MSLYDDILTDLLGATDLSIILRKAKVLAYRLKSKEFKEWIDNEFNGYAENSLLPEYRKFNVIVAGDFINSRMQVNGHFFPVSIVPAEFQSFFNELSIFQGIKELESIVEIMNTKNAEFQRFSIPAELLRFLDNKVFIRTQCLSAWRLLHISQLVQIIDTTKNNLLDFILELADRYPEIKSDSDFVNSIPTEEINRVLNLNIYGGTNQITGSSESLTQGDNMTTFDQRNQKVNTQYNAAGDINFNSVQNKSAFIEELQKLKAEFLKVAEQEAIDGEIVTDAEYQLTKAIQQSQKAEPNKKTITDHLETAKQYIEGITAAASLFTALTEAIKIVQTIFP